MSLIKTCRVGGGSVVLVQAEISIFGGMKKMLDIVLIDSWCA